MIKTVIYRTDFGLGCHAVGLLGCVEIKETPCEGFDGSQSYEYIAIYSDGNRYEVDDLLLATDVSLA